MVRAVQTLGVSALIAAGVLFAICVDQWSHGASGIEPNSELSILERFRQTGGGDDRSSGPVLSPLVEQAQTFASYLTPPEPLKPTRSTVAESSPKQAIPPATFVQTTAKFTLIATSYYGSKPEKSLALISEPGSGTRWVRQGSSLGHFVLEKVERGSILYRNGEQVIPMAVNAKAAVDSEQPSPTTLASDKTERVRPKPPVRRKRTNTRTRQPMRRLGPARPETSAVAFNSATANG